MQADRLPPGQSPAGGVGGGGGVGEGGGVGGGVGGEGEGAPHHFALPSELHVPRQWASESHPGFVLQRPQLLQSGWQLYPQALQVAAGEGVGGVGVGGAGVGGGGVGGPGGGSGPMLALDASCLIW